MFISKFSHPKIAIISFFSALLMAGSVAMAAENVGFMRMTIDDPMGGTMSMSLWYPTDAPAGETRLGPFVFPAVQGADPKSGPFGLVVLSHGYAGSDLGHRNIAIALAQAGIIAVAPLHPRNNFRDNSGGTQRIVAEGRPRQISAAISYLLSAPDWRDRIDERRIGAFGFSFGGYTVLAALGAQPEMSRILDHCQNNDTDPFCRIGVRREEQLRKSIETEYQIPLPDFHDPRICAAAIADPLGVTFSEAEITSIEAGYIRLWRPEHENVISAEPHVSRIVRVLNTRDGADATEEIVVPGAQHYSFLAPFPESILDEVPAKLTQDAAGFDRAAFQAQLATDVSEFLVMGLERCANDT